MQRQARRHQGAGVRGALGSGIVGQEAAPGGQVVLVLLVHPWGRKVGGGRPLKVPGERDVTPWCLQRAAGQSDRETVGDAPRAERWGHPTPDCMHPK